MKKDIHPKYFDNAKFECVCGNKWIGGSTLELNSLGICSKCHPFYSGTEKILDARGRVDKFKKRQEKTAAKTIAKAAAKATPAKPVKKKKAGK